MTDIWKSALAFLSAVCIVSCGTTERATKSGSGSTYHLPAESIDQVTFHDSLTTPEATVLISPSEDDVETVSLIEQGKASWYGPKFNGKLTANGEQFDMNGMTAAHRTLPFNTLVLVRNTDSGKSAFVRINDRGPFAKNRIIDLSKQAARKIGMLGNGTARVQLYVAKKTIDHSKSTHLTAPTYTVQLGSFKTEAKAFNHSSKIKGSRVEIVKKGNHTIYRVYYGLYIDKNMAREKQKELSHKNFSGFVKQIENG